LPNQFDEISKFCLHHVAGAVAFSPQSTLLVTADRDGRRLMGWDPQNGERTWVEAPDVPGIKRLSFTRDGARVVLELAEPGPNSHRGGVAVFDVASRRVLWKSAPLANDPAIDSSPDDRFVAVSQSGKIEIHGLVTGKIVRTFMGHDEGVDLVLFSPDTKRLLSATSTDQACLWDIESGERVATLATLATGAHRTKAVAFLDDEIPMIIARGEGVDYLNVLTGKQVEDVGADGSPFDLRVARIGWMGPYAEWLISKDRNSLLLIWAGHPCIGPFLLIAPRSSDAIGLCVHDFKLVQHGFTPDDRWAYAVVSENIVGPDEPEMSLMLWDASTGEAVARIQPPGGAMQVQFSADGASAVIVGKVRVAVDAGRPAHAISDEAGKPASWQQPQSTAASELGGRNALLRLPAAKTLSPTGGFEPAADERTPYSRSFGHEIEGEDARPVLGDDLGRQA
jgi:WD40 repeat protein